MTMPPHDREGPTIPRGAVAEPASSLRFHTGSWRRERPMHRPRPAPCHAACPAGEDPQAYLARMQEGRLRVAWETLVAANPFPAVTGRVCPHPCERECNRGQLDEAIAIHSVERVLGDAALEQGWSYPMPESSRGGGASVAVVGSGPAGLAAAYHLLRLGHRPTIFEALPEPGGLLRTAIGPYRLPRDVVEAEIARVLDLGVELRTRCALGTHVALDELAQDFEAVVLAVGAERPRPWDVDGVVPADPRSALEVLKEWLSAGAVSVPRRAAIHGGGNTAIDLARVLRRLGAEVHLVTASVRPGAGAPPDDTMNAVPREVDHALEEGVVLHEHATLRRLILRGGRVTGVELARLRKLSGEGGRTRRVAFEGTETVLPVDAVFAATGEIVEPRGVERLLGGRPFLPADAWGRIEGAERVYAAGDARGDAGLVASAVGQGRLAAEAIDRDRRRAADPEAPGAGEPIGFERIHVRYFERAPREQSSVLPPEERDLEGEVEGPLGTPALEREVHRCFSCGSCLACDNCWTLCPDNAVLKTPEPGPEGAPYVFDLEYCKGCGLCAEECPPGFIEMEADR